jgi:hypothetical protein
MAMKKKIGKLPPPFCSGFWKIIVKKDFGVGVL